MLEGDALALEDQVLAEYETINQCLIQQKAKLQMRTTRVAVQNLKVSYDMSGKTLHVSVTLPRGSYFTSLLDHFVDTGNA
jgi:tRNA(Glu) U13 pseudouridine synthase TruD